MIKANNLYITFCDDCGENEGGFYCQIYDSADMDNEVDNIVIPKHKNHMHDLNYAYQYVKKLLNL